MVRRKFALVTLLAGCFLGQPFIAQAGCGCDKPPPELATVRPNATYAGMDVTLFHSNIQTGQSYAVTFASGMTGESATVTSTAVFKRDVADGQEKSQVVVAVPALPLGPTSIVVVPVAALPLAPTSASLAGQSGVVLAVTDDAFTVAPPPIVFPETVGQVSLPGYQAAVSRNGVVYISLDVTDMHLPRTFQAQALGYPIRFTNDEVVFYNTQGFMMQLLDEGMPGLFSIDTTTGSLDSDTLQYSRHEFNTHFLQHAERQTHEVDASDPNWHDDGTPHVDHDHFIVAISGMLDDGSSPAPGATPMFDLAVSTASFFQHGLVGDAEVQMKGNAVTNSYHSQDSSFGWQGDIRSNGLVSLAGNTRVNGNATAFAFSLTQKAQVTGAMTDATEPIEFLPVDVPSTLEDLGSLSLSHDDSLTLGPGSYQVSALLVKGRSTLHIDNTAGPVTLYVTGPVQVEKEASITMSDPNPEKFAVYVAGDSSVMLKGQGVFSGVVYAPESLVHIEGDGEFFGSFLGQMVVLEKNAQVHYDTALRGE